MTLAVGFHCLGQGAPTAPGHVPGGVGVYLHGQAENEAGFDIPDSTVDLSTVPDGLHEATVNGHSGYTLYLWRSTAMLRGLVVKEGDAEGHAHAQARFEARSPCL